ncbi:FkbM family methyltransferase [bacterium SCSIO 12741]|nr:FkbM family methyltransferase [bacterium SCSIO 12741]
MIGILKKKPKKFKISYSQQGEDLIIEFLLQQRGITNPYYVDIGSNDPIRFSNTYLLYKNGGTGICIDPNPVFKKMFAAERPNDVFINAGISGKESGKAMFYDMDWHEFSTFDKEQALAVQENYKGKNNIKAEIELPIISVKELSGKFKSAIDVLNLDVEGLDLEILEGWDFDNHSPKIICVECKDLKTGEVDERIDTLIKSKGYKLSGSNPINRIYTL